ncbi:50S ribosomal protein L4 [bacterium]|nr:50S ribosomal protein L4 [bacterium]
MEKSVETKKVNLHKKDNTVSGSVILQPITLPDYLLVDIKKGQQALFDQILVENANKRQATHSTLTKAEVRGGGKKPRPQKHSGNARQGSIRNPH